MSLLSMPHCQLIRIVFPLRDFLVDKFKPSYDYFYSSSLSSEFESKTTRKWPKGK